MLTFENAENYIRSLHVAIPCTIVSSCQSQIDGIEIIQVTFDYRGNIFVADVWIEGDRLYGEW